MPNQVMDEEDPTKLENELVVDDRDDDFKASGQIRADDLYTHGSKHGGLRDASHSDRDFIMEPQNCYRIPDGFPRKAHDGKR